MNIETLDQLAECIDFSYHLTSDDYVTSRGHVNRNGQSNWSVTITCNGKSFTTEYHKGAAHREFRDKRSLRDAKSVKVCDENGRVKTWLGGITIAQEEALIKSVPIPPDAIEVMYCLTMDAYGTDYNDFEDWCAEYGYDDDSISAKECYDACCKTCKALKSMGFDLDQLSELYQDY